MSAATEPPHTGPATVPTASPLESVDRALQVLTLLGDAGPRGLVLAEIAARLGIHKTTVHRTLSALRHRDYVTQQPGGAYALGASAVALGEQYLAGENLAVLLHAALVALCRDVDELVHLGVLAGDQVVYLDKVEPERPVRVWSQVGHRSSAVRTALGRAVLAFSGTDRATLASYATGVDLEHVWGELERARETGRAVEDQENEPGIGCVAVPVLRGRVPVAAVSVTVPVERLGPGRVEEIHGRMLAVLPALLPDGLVLPGPAAS
ncbi:IclR family transcriptional regulator [Cellulomonas sp. PhB150]|uniref:IclR family transcriptional regulator n=1 Tax=Cellulomonas sp. PhB150 TaxID=2485188 RepID=UPI000F49B03A|nr:IclR family transcriptional regulator [Cellulomonas sp. PhB150]ROS31807.1 IclR family transcriptional regulator [Cellulomonas sp. PhB150]